jgi:outer membrane lipoprotein-sorting protein
MRRNYFVSRVQDSESHATITLINAAGQERVRRVLSVTKLREDGASQMRLARFLFPPDIKGTATLMIEHADRDDDMWIYLPALGKVRRLVARDKRDSYVGTDFTYGDVLGHRPEDYAHRLIGSERIDGADCYVVESTPVSDRVRRESGYGKQVWWVRRDNFVSPKSEGYDVQGHLFKRLTAADLRLVDAALGRWQPMRMEMLNLQTRHRTRLAYDDFRANVGVPAALFTTRSLEKAH